VRTATALAAALAGVSPAVAQTAPVQQAPNPTVLDKFQPVRQLLVDGYEIKTGFADTSGGAYLVLQKAASAYLCHSSPNQVCEKLN
jgi:hypothetical protein